MAVQRTLSIIKPNAVENNVAGKIIARFEEEGLRVVAIRKTLLSKHEAEGFYAEHAGKGFFADLTGFMSRSPSIVMVLEGENAILKNREIMGATNPAEAAENTLRKLYAQSIDENAVHGSDSEQSAAREIAYFFRSTEIF
jgi:nucleoside-diphosphate kinase